MKRRTERILLVVLAVSLAFFWINVQCATAQKPVKLKFASPFPPPGIYPMADIPLYWEKEVTRRTNGAITFEDHWGGSLGAPAEHFDLLKTGVVQVIAATQWYVPSRFPFGDFEYAVPFGVTDYEIVTKAMRQVRSEFPQFAKELEQQNAIMISDPSSSTYNFMSKTPLTKVSDFKGKKVACIGRYFGRWLPPGTTPVVRPGPERYDLLKNGVTNVDLNLMENHYGFKLYEVTGHFIEDLSLMAGCVMPVIMNLQTFKQFSPEIQKILLEAGRDTEIKAAKEIIPKAADKIMKEFRASGVKFVKFPKEEKEKYIATLEDIPAEWAAEVEAAGMPGLKLIQRWQQITAEMGWKWIRQWGVKK